MSKLDTLFAVEFGQLLENHLLVSVNREEEKDLICRALCLRSKNQLAQIFAGYDTPSTAHIFELLRTLNSEELTQRFLKMQTVNLGVQNGIATERETNTDVQADISEPSVVGSKSGWYWEDSPPLRVDRVLDETESEDYHRKVMLDHDFDFEDFDPNLLDE